MTATLLETDIPGLPRFATGKVRDVYDLGDTLLLVTSDRISAFDVVMPNGIPHKGHVLTQLSRFWFRLLRPIVPTHYITCDEDFIFDRIRDAGGTLSEEQENGLRGRSMLGVKAKAFPVECVARGYLAGSLWKEYVRAGGAHSGVLLHGYDFPAGLRESERLPRPIFTPATKAEAGHDENISVERAGEIVGTEAIRELERLTLALYTKAAEMAARNGIIIADTKFEFGLHNDVITLIDEALTPDSSRFWDADIYQPGRSQPSYDKQFVRDWLESSGWPKEPPAPQLPTDVVEPTSEKYTAAYERIVGRALSS